MAKEQCISCGRDDVPLFPVEGAFMPKQYMVCQSCQMRYDQAERDGAKLHSPTRQDLAHEADRIMTEHQTPDEFTCYMCGDPVVFTDKGMVPLYCTRCMCSILRECKSLNG